MMMPANFSAISENEMTYVLSLIHISEPTRLALAWLTSWPPS